MAAATSCSPSCSQNPIPAATPLLLDYLRQVPDPRDPRGLRHPLPSILLLTVVAVLAGRTHNLGISEWGRGSEPALQEALGFAAGKTPAPSTFHEVFRRLDWDTFSRHLRDWAVALWRSLDPAGHAALACDGKAVRGSARAGADVAHLLSVFCSELGITLDLAPVHHKSGELAAAPALLLRVGLAGRVITLDALFTQEALATAILEAGGDYVLPVKGNQPDLRDHIQELCAAPGHAAVSAASTNDRGHGRQELRSLRAVSLTPDAGLVWGGARQVFRLERRRFYRDHRGRSRYSYTITFGITSLGPEEADAGRLLELVRGHWGIEVRSHWIRDTALREDASRTATGEIVQVLTALRCAALTLLHRFGKEQQVSVASAGRRLQQDPWQALRLVGGIA
jgi:predicted transposase YbfD/YdcC